MPSKPFFIGILAAIVCTVFFFYPLIFHIRMPLQYRDDVGYGYFLMDNNLKKLAAGDVAHLFDVRMFFPLKSTLALGNSMIGQAIMGLPLYLVTRDTVVTTNWVMIGNFFLSCVCMFLLAYRISGSIPGSLISAIIYTFNPYMMSRLHPELVVFEWIPLMLLAVEMLLVKISWQWCIVGGITFLLLLSSSFYYIFFAALIIPLYGALRMWREHRGIGYWMRPQIVVIVLVVGVASYWYLKPFMAAKQQYNVRREIMGIEAYSAKVPDFLFTTAENRTYGHFGQSDLARSLWGSYSLIDPFAHPYEHRLFLGSVVVVWFGVISWFFAKKSFTTQETRFVVPIAIVFVLACILMFGPIGRVGTISFPLPYVVVHMLPFGDALRAPTRFIVIAVMAFSMLVSIAFRKVRDPQRVLFFLSVSLLLIEYRYDFGTFVDVPNETKELYKQVSQMSDVHTILEVPMTNGGTGTVFTSRSDIEDAVYLYYALYHDKTIVNGYHAYIPPVYERLGRLVDNEFPSVQKLSELRSLGVDAVIVHLDEYAYPSYGQIAVKGFEAMGIDASARSSTIRVYKIK